MLGAAGSLLFCPDCGTLLDLPRPNEDTVICDQCGHTEPSSCLLYFMTLYLCISDHILLQTRSIRQHQSHYAIASGRVSERASPTSQNSNTSWWRDPATGQGEVSELWPQRSILEGHPDSQCRRRLDNILHLRRMQTWVEGQQLTSSGHMG